MRGGARLSSAGCQSTWNPTGARQPAVSLPRRLDLSEPARVLLRHLRGQKLMDLRGETADLLNRLARVIQEREDLERAIAAAPDDADIGVIVKRLKAATHALTLLNEQAGQLDAAIAAQRLNLEDCNGKLRQLWQGRMDKEFAHEDGRRMIQLAGRTRETMQVFLQRVTAHKIDRLSAFVTESFRFLLRKQTLVERILIDPTTFAITLCDATGQAITKQRLVRGREAALCNFRALGPGTGISPTAARGHRHADGPARRRPPPAPGRALLPQRQPPGDYLLHGHRGGSAVLPSPAAVNRPRLPP